MDQGYLPQLNELLRVTVGSVRYGYRNDSSDQDIFILTPETDLKLYDLNDGSAYFVWSVPMFYKYWGHPVLAGNITGDCIGNDRLCEFLRQDQRSIIYADPGRTALFGLEYIAQGERSGYDSTIKPSLRTAMILSHMAERAEDPFSLSAEEKDILIRARTGGVPPEERVDIYRRTICPENLDKLRRMPENVKVKNELFALLDEICKEERP